MCWCRTCSEKIEADPHRARGAGGTGVRPAVAARDDVAGRAAADGHDVDSLRPPRGHPGAPCACGMAGLYRTGFRSAADAPGSGRCARQCRGDPCRRGAAGAAVGEPRHPHHADSRTHRDGARVAGTGHHLRGSLVQRHAGRARRRAAAGLPQQSARNPGGAQSGHFRTGTQPEWQCRHGIVPSCAVDALPGAPRLDSRHRPAQLAGGGTTRSGNAWKALRSASPQPSRIDLK